MLPDRRCATSKARWSCKRCFRWKRANRRQPVFADNNKAFRYSVVCERQLDDDWAACGLQLDYNWTMTGPPHERLLTPNFHMIAKTARVVFSFGTRATVAPLSKPTSFSQTFPTRSTAESQTNSSEGSLVYDSFPRFRFFFSSLPFNESWGRRRHFRDGVPPLSSRLLLVSPRQI